MKTTIHIPALSSLLAIGVFAATSLLSGQTDSPRMKHKHGEDQAMQNATGSGMVPGDMMQSKMLQMKPMQAGMHQAVTVVPTRDGGAACRGALNGLTRQLIHEHIEHYVIEEATASRAVKRPTKEGQAVIDGYLKEKHGGTATRPNPARSQLRAEPLQCDRQRGRAGTG